MVRNPLDFNRDGKVQYMEYNYASGEYSKGNRETYAKHGCAGFAALYFGYALGLVGAVALLLGLASGGTEYADAWILLLVIAGVLIGAVAISDASKKNRQAPVAAEEAAKAPASEAPTEPAEERAPHRITRGKGAPSIDEARDALANAKRRPVANGAQPGSADCRNCALWVSENPNAARGWGCAVWYLTQENPYAAVNKDGLRDVFPNDGKVCWRFSLGTGRPCRCYDCVHWNRDVLVGGREIGCQIWRDVDRNLDDYQSKIGSMHQFPRPRASSLVHEDDWICESFRLAKDVPPGYGIYMCDVAKQQAAKVKRVETLVLSEDKLYEEASLWTEGLRSGFEDMAIVMDGQGSAFLEVCGRKAADVEEGFAKILYQLDLEKEDAQIAGVKAERVGNYIRCLWIAVSIVRK